MTALLRGIVGSTAYGLARQGSDIDRLGVFVAPTTEVAGLSWNSFRETRTNAGPGHDDFTEHEVGKFCRLALKANPTITELLWLEDYEIITPFGQRLVDIRKAFLSRSHVKNAYLGYASAQARKLENRGDGSFSSDTRNRSVKHARHLKRLLRQGRELLETGNLSVRVSDPEEYWSLDTASVEDMLSMFEKEARYTNDVFEQSKALPNAPDLETVKKFITDIRLNFLQG